jgi:hypothetical protein
MSFKKITIILLILPFLSHNQVSTYGSLKILGGYTSNVSPTIIHASGINDALSSAINIGFTFVFNNESFTQFKASTNGFITFNISNLLAQPTNNLNTSVERYIVAPLWDDNQTGASGNVNYKITGSIPNRILTIEWKALRWNKSGFSAGTIDVQTKLYETSNVIEYVYNRGSYQSFVNSLGIGASIGMNGKISGDFLSLNDLSNSSNKSTTFETTTIGASPTNLTLMTQNAANNQISNGLTFRISPPIALPIELIYFNGTVGNILMWETQSEYNNYYFTLERTIEDKPFEEIEVINGAGTSYTINKYRVSDHSYLPTINYYRLKQTDYDGKFAYSQIISIDNRQKICILLYAVNLYGTIVPIDTKGIILLVYEDGTIKKIFNE